MARRGQDLWELGASFALTALAAVPCLVFFLHAGGLWRDELQAVVLSGLPADASTWRLAASDAPLLLPAVLRAWTFVFGAGDGALRALGLLVSLGVLAALWAAARALGARAPALALALLGANPAVVRGLGSLRGYGLSCLFLLLFAAALARLLESPGRRRWLWAALAALLAVQTQYQAAVPVLALGLAAAAVAALERRRDAALLALATGVPAALSLLPYAPVVARSQEWWIVMKVPVDAAWLWTQASAALGAARPALRWAWVALFLAAPAAAVAAWRARSAARGPAAFAALGSALAAALYLLFLLRASLPTKPWYYLAPMALAALAVDAAAAALPGAASRAGRLALAAALFAAGFGPALSGARVRATSVDAVAAQVAADAAPGDLIVVNPWYAGPTFARYYRGRAEWTTLPPLADVRLQRLDLLKETLGEPHPARPVLERAAAVLKKGGTVWWVGAVAPPPPGERAPDPEPAPGGYGWKDGPYLRAWTLQAGEFLLAHAASVRRLPPAADGPVSPLEDLGALAATGWRP